jgi:hypothetical protein
LSGIFIHAVTVGVAVRGAESHASPVPSQVGVGLRRVRRSAGQLSLIFIHAVTVGVAVRGAVARVTGAIAVGVGPALGSETSWAVVWHFHPRRHRRCRRSGCCRTRRRCHRRRCRSCVGFGDELGSCRSFSSTPSPNRCRHSGSLSHASPVPSPSVSVLQWVGQPLGSCHSFSSTPSPNRCRRSGCCRTRHRCHRRRCRSCVGFGDELGSCHSFSSTPSPSVSPFGVAVARVTGAIAGRCRSALGSEIRWAVVTHFHPRRHRRCRRSGCCRTRHRCHRRRCRSCVGLETAGQLSGIFIHAVTVGVAVRGAVARVTGAIAVGIGPALGWRPPGSCPAFSSTPSPSVSPFGVLNRTRHRCHRRSVSVCVGFADPLGSCHSFSSTPSPSVSPFGVLSHASPVPSPSVSVLRWVRNERTVV